MGSLETEGSPPKGRPVTLKNMMDENQVFSDSLHLKASGVSVYLLSHFKQMRYSLHLCTHQLRKSEIIEKYFTSS